MTEPTDPADGAAEADEPETPADDRRRAGRNSGGERRIRGGRLDVESAEQTEQTPSTAAETDFEGPRRRARREREERRAAQARATAIEEARREAKRRVTGTPNTKKIGRGTVRGLKVLMWTALISVIVVGLGLLLYFTPVMSARNVVVVGLGAVTQDEVTSAVAVEPGTPLLQIDTDTVAERVAAIRRVASVRVQREYPSTLRVTVVERVPVVVKDYPDGPHLFDRDGVDFAIAPPPPGVPYLDTQNPGPNDPPTNGRAGGHDVAAPGGGRAGRPRRRTLGRRNHAAAHRWSPGRVGDHRPHGGEGAQTRGAPHSARPDVRRVQSGPADRQVIAQNSLRACRRACTDRPRTRPTVLVARNNLT